MLIETLKNAALIAGLAMLAAVIVRGLREEMAARRRCRPLQMIDFREPVSGYAPGSETPPWGWAATLLACIAVAAVAYAFINVAVAAGF